MQPDVEVEVVTENQEKMDADVFLLSKDGVKAAKKSKNQRLATRMR